MGLQDSASAGQGRIAVLGGCGFMGSHICRALVRAGRPVRIFDKVYAGRELARDIEGAVEIVEGDIARPDDVLGVVERRAPSSTSCTRRCPALRWLTRLTTWRATS